MAWADSWRLHPGTTRRRRTASYDGSPRHGALPLLLRLRAGGASLWRNGFADDFALQVRRSLRPSRALPRGLARRRACSGVFEASSAFSLRPRRPISRGRRTRPHFAIRRADARRRGIDGAISPWATSPLWLRGLCVALLVRLEALGFGRHGMTVPRSSGARRDSRSTFAPPSPLLVGTTDGSRRSFVLSQARFEEETVC